MVLTTRFKTKISKKDYQAHFQCKSRPNCPFQLKLAEKLNSMNMHVFGEHNHDKDFENIG